MPLLQNDPTRTATSWNRYSGKRQRERLRRIGEILSNYSSTPIKLQSS